MLDRILALITYLTGYVFESHTDAMVSGEDIRTISLSTGHIIQFGYGSGGDGFCYGHQSFDCIDNLTKAEDRAVDRAFGR